MTPDKFLFFDIETIAPPMADDVAEAQTVLLAASVDGDCTTAEAVDAAALISKRYRMRAKKPESVLKAIREDDPHGRMALDKNYAQVCCVSFAVGHDEPDTILCHNEEGQPVEESLIKILETRLPVELGGYVWVGHNCAGFDLPILYRRALKYNANRLAYGIPSRRYDKHYRDTMTMWAGTDWRDMTSLKVIADVLGIERADDSVDGSKVAGMWARREYGAIELYCADDVNLTREVFWRLTDGGVHA